MLASKSYLSTVSIQMSVGVEVCVCLHTITVQVFSGEESTELLCCLVSPVSPAAASISILLEEAAVKPEDLNNTFVILKSRTTKNDFLKKNHI